MAQLTFQQSESSFFGFSNFDSLFEGRQCLYYIHFFVPTHSEIPYDRWTNYLDYFKICILNFSLQNGSLTTFLIL